MVNLLIIPVKSVECGTIVSTICSDFPQSCRIVVTIISRGDTACNHIETISSICTFPVHKIPNKFTGTYNDCRLCAPFVVYSMAYGVCQAMLCLPSSSVYTVVTSMNVGEAVPNWESGKVFCAFFYISSGNGSLSHHQPSPWS